MKNAIRLAERRGKFAGDISRVQQFALTMLMWQEGQDSADARVDQVKLALLASKQGSMVQLFPEYAPEDEGPQVYESDENVDEAKRITDLINNMERNGTLKFEDLAMGEEMSDAYSN